MENQENLSLLVEEARRIALDIEEGQKSQYWKHLKRKIEGWLEAEKKHLQIMNLKLIRTVEDLEDRNDSVKMINLFKQFLEINDTILSEKLSFIGSAKPVVQDRFKRSENFVGRPAETNSNGR